MDIDDGERNLWREFSKGKINISIRTQRDQIRDSLLLTVTCRHKGSDAGHLVLWWWKLLNLSVCHFFPKITSILRGLPCTCLPSWSRQKWLQSRSKQKFPPSFRGWKKILASACVFQVFQFAHRQWTYNLSQEDTKSYWFCLWWF